MRAKKSRVKDGTNRRTNNPKDPNLRRMAARRIEPKVEASTCALGNQRCKKQIGNLTKNANANRIVRKVVRER
jgi:hypothetical protein